MLNALLQFFWDILEAMTHFIHEDTEVPPKEGPATLLGTQVETRVVYHGDKGVGAVEGK